MFTKQRLNLAYTSAQSDRSLSGDQWITKDATFLQAARKNLSQTMGVHRLICAFARHTCIIQSNFDGSNPFETMTICSRQR